ncbi:hypothetical protein PaG_00330 [Moesziomyces aphidis]|uniref:Uncharacterized protein n=1 Tax=Moesziomyces aphidis TaxID=84754 RepID=W3VWX1_MOEAP|nr:hypothetical protein PaG_00330 [Moesziomyces aphidis]
MTITQHRPFVAERKCPSSPNHKGLARRDRCDKRGRPARKGLRNVRHADTGSTSLEADLVALAAVLERRSVELDCGFEACKGPHLASHCVQMQVGRPRQSVHVAFALQARRRVVTSNTSNLLDVRKRGRRGSLHLHHGAQDATCDDDVLAEGADEGKAAIPSRGVAEQRHTRPILRSSEPGILPVCSTLFPPTMQTLALHQLEADAAFRDQRYPVGMADRLTAADGSVR